MVLARRARGEGGARARVCGGRRGWWKGSGSEGKAWRASSIAATLRWEKSYLFRFLPDDSPMSSPAPPAGIPPAVAAPAAAAAANAPAAPDAVPTPAPPAGAGAPPTGIPPAAVAPAGIPPVADWNCRMNPGTGADAAELLNTTVPLLPPAPPSAAGRKIIVPPPPPGIPAVAPPPPTAGGCCPSLKIIVPHAVLLGGEGGPSLMNMVPPPVLGSPRDASSPMRAAASRMAERSNSWVSPRFTGCEDEGGEERRWADAIGGG
jgi:hypothetical protein